MTWLLVKTKKKIPKKIGEGRRHVEQGKIMWPGIQFGHYWFERWLEPTWGTGGEGGRLGVSGQIQVSCHVHRYMYVRVHWDDGTLDKQENRDVYSNLRRLDKHLSPRLLFFLFGFS